MARSRAVRGLENVEYVLLSAGGLSMYLNPGSRQSYVMADPTAGTSRGPGADG